ALRELPLSDDQVCEMVSRLTDGFFLQKPKIIKADSTFFDFRGKIDAIVEHFTPDRLTLEDYLRAAMGQPSLFCQSPATIIASIEGVAGHFCEHGLALTDYVRAAVKQPQLFCQSPVTIIANIEGVAGHFPDHALTLTDYLRAAIKQPALFYQSPGR